MANSILVTSAGDLRQLDAMRGDLLPALEQRSQQRAGMEYRLEIWNCPGKEIRAEAGRGWESGSSLPVT
jgi:hypothetical protein